MFRFPNDTKYTQNPNTLFRGHTQPIENHSSLSNEEYLVWAEKYELLLTNILHPAGLVFVLRGASISMHLDDALSNPRHCFFCLLFLCCHIPSVAFAPVQVQGLPFQTLQFSTSNYRNRMGIVTSLLHGETNGIKEASEPKEISENATHDKEKWTKVSEEYTAAILDPSYLHYPIRGSTVNAALLYPSSFPDRPGLMPGTHKHLGGAFDPTDGCIYGVPANSRSIMCIYPDKDKGGQYQLKTIALPERIQNRQMKWLRGIVAHGYLWAIPAWADSVLCVDLDAYWGRRELPPGQEVVQLLALPEEHPKSMRWQWHGAGINKEQTAIYCIPSNANKVLKVDIATKTTSFIDIQYDSEKYPDFSLDVTNKWYGGIVGDDNAVYGIPYRACAVLRIDSTDDTAKLIGPNYGIGNYFWHGGIKKNGKIYAHPSHAKTVLVIDTKVESKGLISELPIHRAEYDTDDRQNYKWLGGAIGADGNIYCPACDISSILKIDVTTDRCETLGFAGTDKNKWQGGILGRDNCIYCIPANGKHICRIATDPTIQGELPVQLIGDLPAQADKWQGAAMGKDGSLYFIPENGYRVMRVTPPEKPPVIVDGKLPEGDVIVELM